MLKSEIQKWQPTLESIRFSGNHAILEIIDEKCDSRSNSNIIGFILKSVDIMESGLTQKEQQLPPEVEQSSVIDFVESLALEEEGKHF